MNRKYEYACFLFRAKSIADTHCIFHMSSKYVNETCACRQYFIAANKIMTTITLNMAITWYGFAWYCVFDILIKFSNWIQCDNVRWVCFLIRFNWIVEHIYMELNNEISTVCLSMCDTVYFVHRAELFYKFRQKYSLIMNETLIDACIFSTITQ